MPESMACCPLQIKPAGFIANQMPLKSTKCGTGVNVATTDVSCWLSFLTAGCLWLSVSTAAQDSFKIVTDKDSPGHDFERLKDVTLEDCEARCSETDECAAFTYNHRWRMCFLKSQTAPALVDYRGATTGLKQKQQKVDQASGNRGASLVTEDDVTAGQPRPDQPVIVVEPKTNIADASLICSFVRQPLCPHKRYRHSSKILSGGIELIRSS